MKQGFLLIVIVFAFWGCNNSTNTKVAVGNNNSINNVTHSNPTNGSGTMIGKVYNYAPPSGISNLPMLKGYKSSGGTMLWMNNTINYGISLFTKGKANLILFDSCIPSDTGEPLGYKIIDTLFIPVVTDSETLNFTLCSYDTINKDNIIALFKNQTKEIWTNAIKAWEIDLVKRKIISIDTAHIRLNPPDSTEAD